MILHIMYDAYELGDPGCEELYALQREMVEHIASQFGSTVLHMNMLYGSDFDFALVLQLPDDIDVSAKIIHEMKECPTVDSNHLVFGHTKFNHS